MKQTLEPGGKQITGSSTDDKLPLSTDNMVTSFSVMNADVLQARPLQTASKITSEQDLVTERETTNNS